ncbi:hypothetical protein Acsp03_59170 [Actinomadura sp. NBRC 104412]|uniref:DUF3140 domain-containing protein n=1 Tax=Actinomadura sp. NBRC 104412 TaxID=3032203 RepID=UPI0024A1E1CF|nr:DUF3140 domain-containing protein [Actinomadura sp. NBRC 104412]GLZ08451.1 hypothetical protein Acsp03_59170 [Actinomadura sp. NBRC 104412]
MAEPTPADVERLWEQFHQVVNMTSDEIRVWLLTDASNEDGAFSPDPDMHLPELGTQVVEVLRKRKMDLTPHDTDVMRQVVDYVEDRTENPPPSAERNEEWRRSLMSVGHDPLKP